MIRFCLAFFVVVAGCSSVEKSVVEVSRALKMIDEPAPQAPPEAPPAFRNGLKFLETGDSAKASQVLSEFLRSEPTSPWTQSATYHLGRAYEGLGEWTLAAEQFRHVVAATEGRAPKLQAMSLYRLSFCHEALGEDQQTLADLHDLLKRSSFLPAEVRAAELPARLAGAYARVGNFNKAVEYYRDAEAGLLRLKKESQGGAPGWLPQTLFAMGSISSRNIGWDDFEISIRPLARSQIYLLQTAELGHEPWAGRASKDLISTYSHLINVIETPPFLAESEPVLAERTTQDLQLKRAELLMENLRELHARALTTEPRQGSQASREILAYAKEVEKRINALFALRPAGEGPTKESRARRLGVRGRTLDANDESPERKFLQHSRTLPLKAEKSQDPNL